MDFYNQGRSHLITTPFPHPWWCPLYKESPKPKTKDEWAVIDVTNMIKEKSDWMNKFNDETIVKKWKQEIKQQLTATSTSVDNLIDLIFIDLKWTIDTESEIRPFKLSMDERIAYADGLIPQELKRQFESQVNELKSSFAELDYHPGSNKQVIDLVHPSLYPLQYGTTPIINDDGEIEIIQYDAKKVEVKQINEWGKSEHFQWLPSLFKYNAETNKFEIKSYINNLHPIKFKSLYNSLESIFNTILPGLNYVLTRHTAKDYLRIHWEDYKQYSEEYKTKLTEIYNGDLAGAAFNESMEEFEKTKLQYLNPPFIETGGPHSCSPIDLKTFGDIKVITKLADIVLTPDNPTYDGGSWHVEGTIAEDIVATIIYYYETENITESTLSFRAGFDDPHYEQGDSVFCEQIFGIDDEQPMTRDLGGVRTIKDRVLIFPNVFQHHVDSFQLLDNTKSGHRRILAFFIVDPYNHHVVATDKVPVQQKEWWTDGSNILTQEVKDKIKSLNSTLPQSIDEIKEIRTQLMAERSAEVDEDDADEHPYLRQFSLCEH